MKPGPVEVPEAPEPAAKDAASGMESARVTARRYLPDAVALWAGVAFSPDTEASPWTRVQCARLIAQLAGVIPQPLAEAPPGDGSDRS